MSDLSFSVAGLFKSALAQAVITNKWTPRNDLRWRILRINFDTLALYAKAVKIADLMGYQDVVERACAAVKQLVEEEYPLGNEIYRDTSGIYFTFPDRDLPTDLEQEIHRCVEEIEAELAPRVAVEQPQGNTTTEQLKGMLAEGRRRALQDLAQPFDARSLSPRWQQEWEAAGTGKWELCPVCRLRPMQEGQEACKTCLRRRQSRIDLWQKNPQQTIWLGEIADHNDRVALLVGKFGLDGWLSGDLVQTMLVKAVENNPYGCTPKNPSPARLRRVWETCERFWKETVEGEILAQKLANRRVRKHILPNTTNWQAGLYNGKVNGKPIDLFWQREHKAFLTVSNLQAAGEPKPGDTVSLEEPDTKQKSEFRIQDIREEVPDKFKAYNACLPLLASPDQFLAFVPASEALAIAKEIQGEYTRQFGKVRNRLPLSLGVVYFERKMPLMAVMDAARQMLKQPVNSEQWTVSSADGNGQIEFANGIPWNVSTVMGDGTTEDLYYPYFELDGAPAAHHTHRFEHNGKTWVHVKNLQKDDKVSVSPSTFDFLWLDAAARRFEVHYDKNGRRPARPTRPFYLEDLDLLEEVWGVFSKLSRTQLKQILQTIETARERWFGRDEQRQSVTDGTFRQFVQDTLANAQWPREQSWKSMGIASAAAPSRNNMQTKLIEAAVRGELTDLAELHLEILKEKLEGETS